MQYYRCKCGKMTAWTSMGVSACSRCGQCGSDFARGPESHEDPEPHDYVTQYDQNTGAPYERCRRCGERKSALEARNEANTPWTPPETTPPISALPKDGNG